MSVQSIERLHASFVAGVDAACASGTGAEHLLSYFAEVGKDVASTVYLALSVGPSAGDPRLTRLPDLMTGKMVEQIREVFVTLGFGADPFIARAEKAAAQAFAEHLDQLLETAQAGGFA